MVFEVVHLAMVSCSCLRPVSEGTITSVFTAFRWTAGPGVAYPPCEIGHTVH